VVRKAAVIHFSDRGGLIIEHDEHGIRLNVADGVDGSRSFVRD
jgi:hypothetical protein